MAMAGDGAGNVYVARTDFTRKDRGLSMVSD